MVTSNGLPTSAAVLSRRWIAPCGCTISWAIFQRTSSLPTAPAHPLPTAITTATFASVGAITPLHTHNGQLGWMTMIEGKLLVENYKKIDCNRPENQQVVGMDCLAGATRIEMQHLQNELAIPGGPLNTVDKTQTIHRIRNLAEWNEPAVSMHVYSRPIDSCVVFDMDAQRCYRRELKYDNE